MLFDFRCANIDMCCAMIDSMGPYLYLSVDSHGKMKVLLEVMMKKRERVQDFRQQVSEQSLFSFELFLILTLKTVSFNPRMGKNEKIFVPL